MAKIDWENVTNYIDTVGTTLKTFSFNKPQDYVKVTTKGTANVTYTIGTQSGTLTPGQSVEVSEVISSFTLTAVSGTQQIEVYAKEDGTEKEETATDIPSRLNEVESELAQKASQTDLNLKRDKATAITMADLAQDVKTGMTGGSVAVVGTGAVQMINLGNELLEPLADYVAVPATKESGYYANGTGAFTSNANFETYKYPVTTGQNVKVSGVVNGGAMSLIVYFNGAAYAGRVVATGGTNGIDTTFTDYEVAIPAGVTHVAINGRVTTTVLKTYQIVRVATQLSEHSSRISSVESKQLKRYWEGKKIVWLGTSIPEAGGSSSYPMLVAQELGATVVNQALGSSMARNGMATKVVGGTDPYGWAGLAWQNVAYSLSATIAEKQYLIDNWATWQTILTNSPPATLSAEEQTKILNASYENRLVPHLNADLFVFDHGHNDNMLSGADIETIPTNTRDRGYFLGAINYLIDIILANNPKARICFVGHYENQIAGKAKISKAQEIAANYWSFPLLKLWEKLGWSQQTITTTGYWQDNFTWIPSGGSSRTITLPQLWLSDGLHPFALDTRKLIQENVYPFINTVR